MHTRTVIYIHLVPPEARPCPLDRRVTSTLLKSQSALIAPPKYTNPTVRFYTWPAAATVNGTCHPPFVCRHMISVLAPDTTRPNAAHAVTITVIIFSNLSGDRDIMPASSAYSIPHNVCCSYILLQQQCHVEGMHVAAHPCTFLPSEAYLGFRPVVLLLLYGL